MYVCTLIKLFSCLQLGTSHVPARVRGRCHAVQALLVEMIITTMMTITCKMEILAVVRNTTTAMIKPRRDFF